QDFFAYGEEVDLALRLARAGLRCGVEGGAVAWHRGQGSGGLRRRTIRAKYLANHWMLAVRHDSAAALLREAPYVLRGELQYWLPRYLASPRALLMAAADLLRRWRAGRRYYREFERRHGPSAGRLRQLRAQALAELRRARPQ
ncbi:MAG: hypothetical protein M1457_13810, partial [bacterium]|nr:hypothetical protein [bacterium]